MKLPNHIIQTLESQFDRIYVITLERAKERQKRILQRLEGLNFEFFYGVDKNALTEERIVTEQLYDDKKARQLDRYGKGMLVGHIACSLSHRLLYKKILDEGHQRVLIFEDDIVPLYQHLSHLPEALSQLPADWELMYLGFGKNYPVTPKLRRKHQFYLGLSYVGLIRMKPAMVRNALPRPFSPRLLRAGNHDLTHAYAVTPAACEKLIQAQTPVVFNADPLLAYLIMKGEINAFITEPQFFTQEQFVEKGAKSYIHHL
ncbi:MAG: glycosyltransferase family 25 protein [Chitinophagaceae bacterium]|nr:glycosyltransferase family 25 protein [Chitinophagaceae bacterium]